MSKSQREKGARFEREVASILSAALDLQVVRNLSQSRDGGYDLLAGPLVVECKRRKRLGPVAAWYAQAAESDHLGIPIVAMRADQGEPLVTLSLRDLLRLIGGGPK